MCPQVNRTLYGADDSSESWIRYLDHIDDRVQDGLFQLALRSLNLLVESMNPKVHTPGPTWTHHVSECNGVCVCVELQCDPTGPSAAAGNRKCV